MRARARAPFTFPYFPSHQTAKFPPTPSNSSTSPHLIRMISTQVLYLDSNPIPCYHSVCFPYGKPVPASPFPPGVPILPLRPSETFKPFNIPTFQRSAKVSTHPSPLLL